MISRSPLPWQQVIISLVVTKSCDTMQLNWYLQMRSTIPINCVALTNLSNNFPFHENSRDRYRPSQGIYSLSIIVDQAPLTDANWYLYIACKNRLISSSKLAALRQSLCISIVTAKNFVIISWDITAVSLNFICTLFILDP